MAESFRVLVVDDNPLIHEDFNQVLKSANKTPIPKELGDMITERPDSPSPIIPHIDIVHAYQGQEAIDAVQESVNNHNPFAMVFMDVRMPPGMDGIEAIRHLWEIDPDIEAVICTAFSDYSWEHILNELGVTDQLVVLKKPFDPIEVKQLALCLTTKWDLKRRNQRYIGELREEKTLSDMARKKAEESSRVKSDFIAIISHELKTPLTAILGYINLMLKNTSEPLSDLHQESCGRIEINARKLHELIKDILIISEIESGYVHCRSELMDPHAAIKGISKELQSLLNEKGLELVFDFHDDKAQVSSDRMKFETVISNLLSNAIKFTPNGAITLKTWVDDTHFYLSVNDTGIGIAKENQKLIFEKFRQVDASLTRSYRGTGLGLAIARRMAEILDGELKVESELGQGATFTFSLSRSLVSDWANV